MQLRDKHIVVIGAARSGLAAARLLRRNGARVFLTDAGPISAEDQLLLAADGIAYESGGHTQSAFDGEFAVVSPGVPDEAPIVQSYLNAGKPVYAEMELASWFCESPIIGVTGSNGKTTVVTWLKHVWETARQPHHVAGNIGKAFSDVAEECQKNEWAILEVSSFQLDHIDQFHPRISAILNITPDHLDRYQQRFELYIASKMQITRNQSGDDVWVYWNDDMNITSYKNQHPVKCKAWSFSISQPVTEGIFLQNDTLTWRFDQKNTDFMPVADISLPGSHNVLNAMATALIARAAGIPDVAIRTALSTFSGVEHRLELVRELDGVRYFNDSKATNVDAVWHALNSIPAPIVVILGGLDKGNDYSTLLPLLRDKVSSVVAIGKATPTLREQVEPHVTDFKTAETMHEAVQTARKISQPGHSVLLSPACASFDMFTNYEHRGQVFKQAVHELEVTA